MAINITLLGYTNLKFYSPQNAQFTAGTDDNPRIVQVSGDTYNKTIYAIADLVYQRIGSDTPSSIELSNAVDAALAAKGINSLEELFTPFWGQNHNPKSTSFVKSDITNPGVQLSLVENVVSSGQKIYSLRMIYTFVGSYTIKQAYQRFISLSRIIMTDKLNKYNSSDANMIVDYEYNYTSAVGLPKVSYSGLGSLGTMPDSTGNCKYSLSVPSKQIIYETLNVSYSAAFVGYVGDESFSVSKCTQLTGWKDGSGVGYDKDAQTGVIIDDLNLTAVLDVSCSYGYPTYLVAPEASQSGYKFLGWSTTNGGAVAYTKGATIYKSVLVSKEGVVTPVYAKMEALQPCVIKFLGNADNALPEDGNGYIGEEYTIPSTIMQSEGYSFDGWSWNGELKQPNDTIVPTKATEYIYARFTKLSNNKIAIVGDDGISSVTVNGQAYSAEDGYFVADNLKLGDKFTYSASPKLGYVIVGKTEDTYSVKGTEGRGDDGEPGLTINITSQKATYQLSVEVDNGVKSVKVVFGGNEVTLYNNGHVMVEYDAPVTITAIANDGYSIKSITSINKMPAANKTISVVSQTQTYNVTYNLSTQGYTGESASDPKNSIVITGNKTSYAYSSADQPLSLGNISGCPATHKLSISADNRCTIAEGTATMNIPGGTVGNINVNITLVPITNASLSVTSVTPTKLSTLGNNNGVEITSVRTNEVVITQTSGADLPILVEFSSDDISSSNLLSYKCYSDRALTTEVSNDAIGTFTLSSTKEIYARFCEKNTRQVNKTLYYAFTFNNEVVLTIAVTLCDVPYITLLPMTEENYVKAQAQNPDWLIASAFNTKNDAYTKFYRYSSVFSAYPVDELIVHGKDYIVVPVIFCTSQSQYARMAVVVVYKNTLKSIAKGKDLFLVDGNKFHAIGIAKDASETESNTLSVTSSNYNDAITLKINRMTYENIIKKYIKQSDYSALLSSVTTYGD